MSAKPDGILFDDILFFDDVCGFCSRSITFFLTHERRDADTSLAFAPLLGETAERYLVTSNRHETMILLRCRNAGNELLFGADAAVALLSRMSIHWRNIGALARLVPRSVRNSIYAMIAKRRHRLIPGYCVVPTPDVRARFLP